MRVVEGACDGENRIHSLDSSSCCWDGASGISSAGACNDVEYDFCRRGAWGGTRNAMGARLNGGKRSDQGKRTPSPQLRMAIGLRRENKKEQKSAKGRV